MFWLKVSPFQNQSILIFYSVRIHHKSTTRSVCPCLLIAIAFTLQIDFTDFICKSIRSILHIQLFLYELSVETVGIKNGTSIEFRHWFRPVSNYWFTFFFVIHFHERHVSVNGPKSEPNSGKKLDMVYNSSYLGIYFIQIIIYFN